MWCRLARLQIKRNIFMRNLWLIVYINNAGKWSAHMYLCFAVVRLEWCEIRTGSCGVRMGAKSFRPSQTWTGEPYILSCLKPFSITLSLGYIMRPALELFSHFVSLCGRFCATSLSSRSQIKQHRLRPSSTCTLSEPMVCLWVFPLSLVFLY